MKRIIRLALVICMSFAISMPCYAASLSFNYEPDAFVFGRGDMDRVTEAAILNDSSLYMWGDNYHSQMGGFQGNYEYRAAIGAYRKQSVPLKTGDDVSAIFFSRGFDLNAMIKTDQSLWMWGYGRNCGQLGIQMESEYFHQVSPVKVMENVKKVCFGGNSDHAFAAAIKTDDSLWMWGINDVGQLGNGGSGNKLVESKICQTEPIKIMDHVVDVYADDYYAVALKDDKTLWMWGRSPSGLGGNTLFSIGSEFSLVPIKILDDVLSFEFCSGYYPLAAAIRSDMSLWMWGSNAYGQLGNGQVGGEYQQLPVKVMDNVLKIHFAGKSIAVIKTDGSLYMWGDNSFGTIGDGSYGYKNSSGTPQKIMDNVEDVFPGDSSIAAIKKDGSLWTWGNNSSGELGNGGVFNAINNDIFPTAINLQTIPIQIMDNVVDVKWVSIDYGERTCAAIKNDGSLWMWGNNISFQLGNDTQNDSSVPVKVLDGLMLSGDKGFRNKPELPSSWAAESVDFAIMAGIVPQNLQCNYTEATSRAEFCALATALYESIKGDIQERQFFSDTSDVNVQKMAALGVAKGMGDGKFMPDALLTREQAATMLARLAKALDNSLSNNTATFADNSSISSWAFDAVGQMQASGIMDGVGNNCFSPKGDYTREQSIVTMNRLLVLVSGENSVL